MDLELVLEFLILQVTSYLCSSVSPSSVNLVDADLTASNIAEHLGLLESHIKENNNKDKRILKLLPYDQLWMKEGRPTFDKSPSKSPDIPIAIIVASGIQENSNNHTKNFVDSYRNINGSQAGYDTQNINKHYSKFNETKYINHFNKHISNNTYEAKSNSDNENKNTDHLDPIIRDGSNKRTLDANANNGNRLLGTYSNENTVEAYITKHEDSGIPKGNIDSKIINNNLNNTSKHMPNYSNTKVKYFEEKVSAELSSQETNNHVDFSKHKQNRLDNITSLIHKDNEKTKKFNLEYQNIRDTQTSKQTDSTEIESNTKITLLLPGGLSANDKIKLCQKEMKHDYHDHESKENFKFSFIFNK